MKLTELYRICGEAAALSLRAIPEREVRLMPYGWLAVSGEPYANFNEVLVDAGSDGATQLRAFHQVLQLSRKEK